jgi:hypothetical protein
MNRVWANAEAAAYFETIGRMEGAGTEWAA